MSAGDSILHLQTTEDGFTFSVKALPSTLWWISAGLLIVVGAVLMAVIELLPLGWLILVGLGMLALAVRPPKFLTVPNQWLTDAFKQETLLTFEVHADGLSVEDRTYDWEALGKATFWRSGMALGGQNNEGETFRWVGLSAEQHGRLLNTFLKTAPIPLPAVSDALEVLESEVREQEEALERLTGLSSPTLLSISTNVDGFAFTVPPRQRPFGCLVLPFSFVGFALASVALVWSASMVLPDALSFVPGALGIVCMLGTFFGSAWVSSGVDQKYVETYRKDFVVDRLGLKTGDHRYSWKQVGQPSVSGDGMVLADGTRFRWGDIHPGQVNALAQHFADAEPTHDTEGDVPAALAAALARERLTQ